MVLSCEQCFGIRFLGSGFFPFLFEFAVGGLCILSFWSLVGGMLFGVSGLLQLLYHGCLTPSRVSHGCLTPSRVSHGCLTLAV